MAIRLYLSPIIGVGTRDNAYRAKVRGRMLIPTHPRGHQSYGQPRFTWTVVATRQASYTTEDADTDNFRLFGVDLPDTINSYAELRTYLQSRTLAQIPADRRATIQQQLTDRGVDQTGFVGSTTWWQVLQRVRLHLVGFEPVGI